MVERFIEYLNSHGLLPEANKTIVAVSGGIDSMVLANLYIKSGIKPAVAHCNFKLRGEESDGDEAFVRSFAEKNGLIFFHTKFNTSDYAATNRLSIQMAARELRYNWFEKIREENEYDAIAVAHNLNDNVETFFINLIRGTGINGLTGMKPVCGKIIRPLLFATREEIVEFAKAEHIDFREDSSNAQVKYVRNKIRHMVMPLLAEINSDILYSVTSTMEHLSGSSEIINRTIEKLREELFSSEADGIHVNADKLKQLEPAGYYIFELFRTYGLSSHQTGELQSVLYGGAGKTLYTNGYRIIKDRNELIITERDRNEVLPTVFNTYKELSESTVFSSVRIADASTVSPDRDPSTAFIDADTISYPLTYRRWEAGDRFSPLGMKGMKKISDFLVDNKISRAAKDNVMVLLSGQDIVWVAGLRLDDRFRVTAETTDILVISL